LQSNCKAYAELKCQSRMYRPATAKETMLVKN